jgi:hypothetical protein
MNKFDFYLNKWSNDKADVYHFLSPEKSAQIAKEEKERSQLSFFGKIAYDFAVTIKDLFKSNDTYGEAKTNALKLEQK